MATRDKKPSAFGKTGNVLTTVNPSIDNLAQSLTLGDTKVFGSNTVNALRFAFNRTAVNRDNDPFFDPPTLGIKASTATCRAQMIVVVTGGFNIAAATATRGIADNNSFQVNDDLTVVRGDHQLGFGANVARFRVVDQKTWARGGGQWNFTRPGIRAGAGGLAARPRGDARSVRARPAWRLLPVVPRRHMRRTRGARRAA